MSRACLWLAALDSLLYGAWAVFRPGDLFDALRLPSSPEVLTPDAVLVRGLGFLLLTHAVCLAVADRPAFRGLVWLPVVGRALLAGVWLWLLGTDRVAADRTALFCLLAHDAFWLAVLLWYAGTRRGT